MFSTAFTFALSVSAQIPSYVPSNGLVGWWPFNGNANDESGNGNHGTVNGASLTSNRFGVANSSYLFNGTSDYIEVPHSQSLAIEGDLTISLWKNSIGNFGNYETFVNKRSIQSNWNYSFGASHYFGTGGCPQEVNKYFTSRRNNSGLQYELKFTDYLVSNDTNTWTHLVVSISQNVVKFYVNGMETGFSCFGNQFSIQSVDVGAPLNFGASLPNFNEFFHGSLDDIGIWNRALTACEIQDLYQAQVGYTTVNAGLDQSVCAGNNVVLQGSGGNFLSWNNGVFDGVPFTPNQTSAYVLTGADTLGCVGVDTVVVTVLETSSSTMNETALDSYTWLVNGQTYTQSGTYVDTLMNAAGCDSVVTLNLTMEHTGIGEFHQVQFNLIPNPNDGNFVIQSQNEALINSIQVTDLAGQILVESKGNQTEFQLVDIKSGTYFVTIKSEYGMQTIKYVKQ